MKYFILSEEEKNSLPQIKNWFGILSAKDNSENFFHIPAWNMLDTDIKEKTLYGDIVSFPCILITEKVLQVLKLYQGTLPFKHIILLDKKNEKFFAYLLVKLPIQHGLSKESILDKTKSKLIKGILDRKKVEGIPFFLVKEITKPTFIIREDVTESLIRRGIRGIRLQELDII